MVTQNTDNNGTQTPFATMPLYRRKGWLGTLMLPTGAKNPPPEGFTGKSAPYPTGDDMRSWPTEQMRRAALRVHGVVNFDRPNICLRLAGVDDDHEVIGIDVDHYIKGDKQKTGRDQLEAIATELNCELPATWTSSARTDGKSGIRYYRVPRGLHFRGKAAADIEIIQKGHRFAVVWPSINPDTGGTVYWWFPPGAPLTEAGKSLWDGTVPDARTLPLLPDAWIDYLTHNRTTVADEPMDADSSVDDITAWAYATLGKGEPLCVRMNEKLTKHLAMIRDEATSHDKLVNAHMNIMLLAQEGHRGWDSAVAAIEKQFRATCSERDKRDPGEVRGEIFRSRSRGMRKVKGRCDERLKAGVTATDAPCECGTDADRGSYPDAKTFAKFLRRLAKLIKPNTAANGPVNAMANRPELYDAMISEYIAGRYLKTYCHSGALGWMHWTGKHWRSVGEPIVIEATRQGVLAFHREETNLFQSGAVTADRLAATARLLSANRIGSIVRLAKGCLTVPNERWDAHPDLLNCSNGVVDLRTGALLDHDPDFMFTKLCPTEYRSGTTHPDWNAALRAVPQDAREWLQHRMGQGLTGYMTPDDVLTLLKGGGENGKSTVVGGIIKAVGSDYAVTLPERALLARPGDHPTELMTLRGARLAFMEELPELGHLNVKQLKLICGTPRLTARYIGQNSMEWDATHTAFVTTNHWPRVDESDHGTWRRLRAVKFPFRYRKPGETIETRLDKHGDPGLRQRIIAGRDKQHEAILSWLIDGAIAWYSNRDSALSDTSSITNNTEEWRSSADHILRLMRQVFIADPTSYMMGTDVYSVVKRWMENQGHIAWSDQTFATRFENHPHVQASGIIKKLMRANARGRTLHRPELTDTPVPQQFHAWVGIRPRRDSDGFPDEMAAIKEKCSDVHKQ